MEEQVDNTQSKYDDIIIAVHGIGDQMRNATIRDVATRFARMQNLAGNGVFVAPQPLGYFHTDVRDAVQVSPLGESVPDSRLSRIGFSEVYWADIPQLAVDDGHTMDETKAWARTVVSRVRAVYYRTKSELDDAKQRSIEATRKLQLAEPDFTMAVEVLEEIIDTVAVLENLGFLAKKAGIGDFELGRVLQQFVGDVQVVTEFRFFRMNIIGRFHQAMEQIAKDHARARLHIVAHSEGTVISFLALLHALAGEQVVPRPGSKDTLIDKTRGVPAWVQQVQGFFTIGSPIDKHLLLWPELFRNFRFEGSPRAGSPIQWRNYYDYGDPVGFRLDTARQWLSEVHCTAFDFNANDGVKRDFGFARYLLPGKAHTDYWRDAAVFEHMVYDVIAPHGTKPTAPRTRPLVYALSPLIPYFLSFFLLYAGALLLHRAVSLHLRPPLDPVQSYAIWNNNGTIPATSLPGGQLCREALGLALLYAGTTLLARWPRLAKGATWWIAGILAFTVGAASYVALVSGESRRNIASLFNCLGGDPTIWTLAAALVVALIGLTGISKPETASSKAKPAHEPTKMGERVGNAAQACAATLFNTRAPRRNRWFSRQMRPLLICGGVLIAGLVISQLRTQTSRLSDEDRREIAERYVRRKSMELQRTRRGEAIDRATLAGLERDGEERAAQFAVLIQPRSPMWPVVLSGAAFLYLWWLAALIFDLGFVWQRYVRQSSTLTRLEQWRQVRIKSNPK
jgi:hypothetical protein